MDNDLNLRIEILRRCEDVGSPAVLHRPPSGTSRIPVNCSSPIPLMSEQGIYNSPPVESDAEDTVSERIRRKSFYSRFNTDGFGGSLRRRSCSRSSLSGSSCNLDAIYMNGSASSNGGCYSRGHSQEPVRRSVFVHLF